MRASVDDPASRIWDFVVVGTGIGGATLGYQLSKAGYSVLFCEQGQSYYTAQDVLQGDWLEALVTRDSGPTLEEMFRAGRFSAAMSDVSSGPPRTLRPVLGTGTGGSSALYGMVMERFFPSDFEPAQTFPDCPEANLPEKWPISYEDLAPHYTEAERLYRVHASRDPLHPAGEDRGIVEPPPLTRASQELVERFSVKGLHPYRLPMACDYVPGCRECIGYICDKRCKRDSVTSCLEPALRDHGASLISECEVTSLEVENSRVRFVHAHLQGKPVRLTAKTVVLAAGAFRTPALLLKSGDEGRGLSNGSDQVGRNLMRHLVDYYLLYPKAPPSEGPLKQIAFNDLYVSGGQKLGTVQSNGRLPPVASIAKYFREDMRSFGGPLAHLFPLIRPAVEFRVRRMLAGAHVMVSFLEDLPFATNRVTLSKDRERLDFAYQIHRYDQARLVSFRGKIADLMRPHPFKAIYRAERNTTLGHACGTCRFGNDPKTSVLDRFNRTHEIDNLYVVDGSFLPTSSGTNPSLTIAANALRVADHLANTH
ncbi:GMC family oxidoreductase [Mesorhizobium sp. B3-1-3]|uniref:FAD-dependent oxidoreductase n=1 Tax=unclassified Mesorhizobium TaxID=325217 RepID=UPI00112CB9FE|nr:MULTISPECIES: GMC family oxidoreductase [unclassified Mesorhizobium]TPI57344.1 GMC family oxidoreductase [Mesorhizobium sp. B3-1-8]TPI63497.1 GMC family oxidoreductase [Mesorhizobium sp. B3-1-3]